MFFYVEPGGDAVSRAFKRCGELMKAGNCMETAIVIPQLSNLDGLISEVLGTEAVKALAKHKAIRLNPETLRLFTKRQPPRLFRGPLLVAFTPVDQLKAIIRDNPGAGIVFVPWSADERDFFVNNYSPTLVP